MACVIGVGGLLFLVGLVAVISDKQIPPPVLVLVVSLYLAAWFGVLYQIIGQITRLVDANLAERDTA
ncbi:MAG: hypothetical protein ABR535_00940, partial [Pyrinomonadaceae bacterium]